MARAAGGNGIVAALHSKGSGIVFVACRFAVARKRSVISVWPKTVRPTVIHLAAFHANVASGSGDRRGRSNGSGSDGSGSNSKVGSRWKGRDGVGMMSSVKSRGASSEATYAFFIAKEKLTFEEGNGPFGRGTQAEFFGGGGKETGGLYHCKSQGDDGDLRNWHAAKGGHTLNIGQFGP